MTPAVEKAVKELDTLQVRAFVGTESRLDTIVTLLRDLALGSEPDTGRRLLELHRRRDELDREIEAVHAGTSPLLDDTAHAERFDQVTHLRPRSRTCGSWSTSLEGQFPGAAGIRLTPSGSCGTGWWSSFPTTPAS